MNLAEKRILRDVNTVMTTHKDLLGSQGIYYLPNEQTMKRGIALLVGQSDTPYFGGFYFFDISFPDDYPFSPIKVRSLTQDGVTRFNPNMYREGKVCLSILNTWHDGPQWSGVQTLESILLLILSMRVLSVLA
jgi:ubiquitin-protein ligase